jgi:hypothetical protein
MAKAHRDAKSAWQWLVKKGGIEPEGRDLPLVIMLKDRLDPESSSLAKALSSATVTVFLNTFFGVISPFVTMMRDLLEYFETAGATEGPVNWVLVLGDDTAKLEVDLDAFRKWIRAVGHSKRGARTVPDLPAHELWEMRKCFYPTRKKDPSVAPGEEDYRQPEPRVKSAELTNWLDAYKNGDYLDLPAEASVALADKGPIGDVAALLAEIYSAIRTIGRNVEELKRKGRVSQAGDHFWSARGLWYFESDYWVRGRVLDLAAYDQATKKQQAQVRTELSTFFENHRRRRMKQDIDISDLEQILSLPIWKKRYELYSAWIVTLLLKALEGHAIELEHDNGRISFSFRETLMAHVLSAVPPVAIYSERRVAVTNPVGHGRSGGAQPDYSFWTEDGKCPLAVECKHYKRSSTRNFADALNDYSAALVSAQIVLANYGPVSPAVLEAIEDDRHNRCRAIGNVSPAEAEAMEKISDIVREAIGDPRPLPHLQGLSRALGSAKPKLLVVDISGSMRMILDHPSGSGSDSLRNLISVARVNEIAAVDSALVAIGGVHELKEILSKQGSASTDLGPAVKDLLKTHGSVLVLTDADGTKSLNPLRSRRLAVLPFQTMAGDVQLLLVR